MARGGVEFEGIGAAYATFKAADAIKTAVTASGVGYIEGKAVTITGNDEVGFGANGAPLLGKALKYEGDGYLSVQYKGYTVLPGVSGSLPTAGNFLVVDGAGAVKASTGAVGPARAISVDSTYNTVMVLIS